jgi:hypothetical protein
MAGDRAVRDRHAGAQARAGFLAGGAEANVVPFSSGRTGAAFRPTLAEERSRPWWRRIRLRAV